MNKINHIGFILDGNGRWAKSINKPRTYGHYIGSKKIKEVIDWCSELSIKAVSLYLFSLENWKRPKYEVRYLMKLLFDYFKKIDLKELEKKGIRIVWTGIEKNLDLKLINMINNIQSKTINNNKIILNLNFNYSSQQHIVDTVNYFVSNNQIVEIKDFNEKLDKYKLGSLDLVIRTSGEQRLSNFMLWESSYAELIFSKLFWPEYSKEEFENNIKEFYKRIRKFGNIE